MPRSNPKRAKGRRVVRCWALWWRQGDEHGQRYAPGLYVTKKQAALARATWMFPEDYELTQVEVRELPRRSKAKPWP